jgi:transcriptional accessory protein Tex/SPT6
MNDKDHISFDYQDGVSLKEFLLNKISDLEKRLDQHFKLNTLALEKADEKMSVRLASMNEFREALKDQTSRFIDRTEYSSIKDRMTAFCMRSDFDQSVARIEDKIRTLELSRAELAGKASQRSVTIATVLAVFGMVMGFVGFLLRAIR